MKFNCQVAECVKEAKLSCIYDPKVMFCSLHFLDIHLKFPGKHKSIAISDQIKNLHSKLQIAYKALEEAKNLIISKGYLMITKIKSAIQKNLSKLIEKKTEICEILKSKNTPQECLRLLENVTILELVGEPLDNFEEIIEKYIAFNSNCSKPPAIDIKRLIEDNQKMKDEIIELKEYSTSLKQKSNL
jgi:hypothetical protein